MAEEGVGTMVRGQMLLRARERFRGSMITNILKEHST